MNIEIGKTLAINVIREHYGEQAASTVDVLGEGHWSKAFAFTHDANAFVLRMGAHLTDFQTDREAAQYRRAVLPIPRVVKIGPCDAGWFAISERCYGTAIEDLSADAWERVSPKLLATLDALRDVTFTNGIHWSRADAPDTTTWRSWLVDSLVDNPDARGGGWTETLLKHPDAYQAFIAGSEMLHQLVPSMPELRCLLHRDWLHGNVLANPATGELTGIFDWGCSLAGDFVYDIAWFTFWAPWHAGLNAIDFRSKVLEHYANSGVSVPDFDKRLRCYELHIALEHIAYSASIGRTETLADLVDATKRLL